MADLTDEEVARLRKILADADAEEAAEVIEEVIDAIPPDETITEEAEELIEEATEIIETEEEAEHESHSEDSSEEESASGESGETPIDVGESIASNDEGEPINPEPPPVSADFIESDVAPKPSHWWYRNIKRG